MTDQANSQTTLLPKVLQDFVRHIGFAATMAVVDQYGGTRLYVPAKPHAGHPLAQLIGLEKLRLLSKIYGLEDHFDIPKAMRLMRHTRNAKIRSEYGPKSAAKLAREHKLTERQIFTIVGREALQNTHQSPMLF